MAGRTSIKTDANYRISRRASLLQQQSDPSPIHNEVATAQPPAGTASLPASRPAAISDNGPRRAVEPFKTADYVGTWVFTASMLATLSTAWWIRNEGEVTPETGLGYALGIIGSLMMLALLLYPLRKNWKRLHQSGSVRTWFTVHMLLGVLGPTLIVVHSNFSLKSTNATVAMTIMLLVVASGLFGRYIYNQIHVGMSGRRSDLRGLLADVATMREVFGADMEQAPEIRAQLLTFEADAKALRVTQYGSFRATVLLAPRSRRLQKQVKAEAQAIISARALREHWDAATHRRRTDEALKHLDTYFATLRRATSLHFFGRLFRLWHVLHMPLFLLLIMVAIGHVIAVHLY